MASDRPFAKEVMRLLDEREWSIRRLHREMERLDLQVALSTVHLQISGQQEPTARVVAAVSTALGLDPLYFPEARAFRMRDLLDPKRENTERMVETLRRLAELDWDFEQGDVGDGEPVGLPALRERRDELMAAIESYEDDTGFSQAGKSMADTALSAMSAAILAEEG